MTTDNSAGLLDYIILQANSGQKNWFSHQQQRIAGIHLAYEIAKNHANTMTPEEVADYTVALNNEIYKKIVVKGE